MLNNPCPIRNQDSLLESIKSYIRLHYNDIKNSSSINTIYYKDNYFICISSSNKLDNIVSCRKMIKMVDDLKCTSGFYYHYQKYLYDSFIYRLFVVSCKNIYVFAGYGKFDNLGCVL